MTLDRALAFLVFAAVAAGTPGPSNVLVAATGASVGIVRGLPCLFGVSAGMGLLMFAFAAGFGALMIATPTALRILHWAGAAVLLWLAWKIATADPRPATATAKPVGFVGAATFQWMNPKSWLVAASAAGTYLEPASAGALGQALSFGLLFTVVAFPCCFLWLALGASAQRWLRTEQARRRFNVVMGLLLAGSVILVVR